MQICSCFIKIKLPLISEIKFDKEKLFSNFKNIKNIGNFEMLKCINLLFDKNNIFKNTANYMIILLFILSLIALFGFICYNNIYIKKIIIKLSKINKQDNSKVNRINNSNNKAKNKKNNKENKKSKNKNNKNKGKNNILNRNKKGKKKVLFFVYRKVKKREKADK